MARKKRGGNKVKKKKGKYIIIILLAIFCIITTVALCSKNESETGFVPVKTEAKLKKLCRKDYHGIEPLKVIMGMPFAILEMNQSIGNMSITDAMGSSDAMSSNGTVQVEETTKDYSKTNVQVENVDEADVIKTDGDYIYSLSENKVIITNVKEPDKINIVSSIEMKGNTIPEDLLLKENFLILIGSNTSLGERRYSYQIDGQTIVEIYDITNKEKPNLVKSSQFNADYYTSRRIENKLYIISSDYINHNTIENVTTYEEDGKKRDISLHNIYYPKGMTEKIYYQTQIAVFDLQKLEEPIKVKTYLMDLQNSYISEKNIYLLEKHYKDNKEFSIKNLFGWNGVIQYFQYLTGDYEYSQKTTIYKFELGKEEEISYTAQTTLKGTTVDQFSLDEYQDVLRVALYNSEGTRVVTLDNQLKILGETEKLAKGERMYSSRFMGDKVYLVTYRTIDPLFVVDLGNPKQPIKLGELKIPGYSTYLHPYDENHIIGIGMETREKIYRDNKGKVVSVTPEIIGMKMALFDVTNVNQPILMDSQVIGDARTTSAILTNHKALLFSKEKQLLAIPVNNYKEDFSVNSSENYSSLINSYRNYAKEYTAEGYLVYHINVEDGIDLKGSVIHNTKKTSGYGITTGLLRGIYIEDNLYTVSESAIKVNDLEDLQLVSQVEIK